MLVMWSWQIKTHSPESRIGPGQNSERESTASFEPAAGNRVQDNDETVLQIDLRVNGIRSDEIYEDKQKMQSITNQIEKLVDTEKSLQEEPLKNDILSEEAAMKI